MTEKEKMIAGSAYQAGDKELSEERLKCRELVQEFNNTNPKQFKHRKQILAKLLGKVERMYYIEPPFHCDYGYNIEIGEQFYANFNLIILDCAKVQIGSNVFFGSNVALYTAGHPMHPNLRNKQVEWAKPITIGDNVWFGGNVVVNPGIKIGSNSVIGSGSVISKDIPDWVFAAGNPCKVIRQITEQEKDFYYRNVEIENQEE